MSALVIITDTFNTSICEILSDYLIFQGNKHSKDVKDIKCKLFTHRYIGELQH